jgi:regulator of replication initiation timing
MPYKYSPITFTLRSMCLALVFLVGGTGCQEFRPYPINSESFGRPASPSPSSILAPNPQDATFLHGLGIRADNQLSQCRKPENCSQAHFLKALTTLHTNQEIASYHFGKVVESSSQPRLSQASRVWLWLLEEIHASNSQTISAHAVNRELIQALLQRDLGLLENPSMETLIPPDLKSLLIANETKIQALSEQVHELSQEVTTLKTETASIQSLQKQLQLRNKKVTELTSQLDALRRIDQELKEKAPPTTPSETILPPKEETRDNP